MSETESRNYERTLEEARLDAEFYAVYHARHVRFWRRFRSFCKFTTALVGAGAVAGWLSKNPGMAAWSGGLIAALVALDQSVEPAEQLARHKEFARRYRLLIASRIDSLDAFDRALTELHAEVDAPGFDALRVPAFNDVVRAAGRTDYVMPVTRWQRLVSLLA